MISSMIMSTLVGVDPFHPSQLLMKTNLGGGDSDIWASLLLAVGYRILARIAFRNAVSNLMNRATDSIKIVDS